MKENIKVAFIGYNLTCGGAERNIINLAHYLQKKGVQADIILFKNINEYKDEYEDILKKLTIIPLLNTRNKIPKLLFFPKLIELFIRLFYMIKKNRYQLLIGALEPHPYFFAVFFAKLFKIKSVLIFNEGTREKSGLEKLITDFLLKIVLTTSSKIVCISQGVSYFLQINYQVLKRKIVVIYDGLNIQRIYQKTRELISRGDNNLLKSGDLIVTMGRLVEKKGQGYLIDSFKRIKATYPNSKLVIVGRGELEIFLKNRVRQLNLEGKVYFLGNKKPLRNPYQYLKKAKLFVFSSLYEGFGNVIIEAMACGVPVIAADCPYGPREILSGGGVVYPYKPVNKITYCKYGILVPPFDNNSKENISKEKLLAKAILTLLTNNKLRDHYRKMSLVRTQDFSLEKMGESYYQTIKELVSS